MVHIIAQSFPGIQKYVRWLYLLDEPKIQRDDHGHGACVPSKVAGPTFGVAKSANIAIDKIYPIGGMISISRIIAAWLGALSREIFFHRTCGPGMSLVMRWAVSNQGLEFWEARFNT